MLKTNRAIAAYNNYMYTVTLSTPSLDAIIDQYQELHEALTAEFEQLCRATELARPEAKAACNSEAFNLGYLRSLVTIHFQKLFSFLRNADNAPSKESVQEAYTDIDKEMFADTVQARHRR